MISVHSDNIWHSTHQFAIRRWTGKTFSSATFQCNSACARALSVEWLVSRFRFTTYFSHSRRRPCIRERRGHSPLRRRRRAGRGGGREAQRIAARHSGDGAVADARSTRSLSVAEVRVRQDSRTVERPTVESAKNRLRNTR